MIENILFLISISSFLLGLFVVFANRKSISNISFFILCIVGGTLWSISIAMFRKATSIEEGLFWNKIIYLCGILAPIAILFFSYCFPNAKTKIPLSYKFLLTFPIIILTPVLFQTTWWIKKVVISSLGNIAILGNFYKVWLVYICFYFCWSLILLFAKYKKSKDDAEKHQFQYIFLGLLFPLIGCLPFNVILPFFGNYNLIWVGPITIVPCIVLIAFAIVKYHLFEIKVILTELLVGIMGILLLILPLLMPTPGLKLLTTILFLLFCIFGYLLISYTHQEIKRRQEIEKLSDQLQVSNIKLEAALEELRKSYDELKQLDDAKTMFLSIASHQLRTPLSAMKGYLSMVLSGEYGIKIEGQVKNFLLNVYQSNERLIGLVNDILDITRLQMGKMQFNFQPTKLEDLVQSVVEELKPQIKQKNISLEFQKPKEPLPKVKLDPQKFRQVILNLIDNALKYTEKGKILISLYQKPPNSVLLTVKDTGIGMEKEELDDLFQLFERGAEAVKTNAVGVGIGLYASREIVKAHQGKIWAESEGKGKGSTFYVEIPVE